jgi:Ca-activated chloride channel family protein
MTGRLSGRGRACVAFLVQLALLIGFLPGVVGSARAQARERDLFVSVLDKDGQPVKGLGAEDFIVREDGVAREVLRVRQASEPMQIALLVDNSAATSAAIPDMRKALHTFIDRMTGRGEVALVTYAERPTIAVDYTSDLTRQKAGVDRLFAIPGSGAYSLDAILETARGLRKREAARPHIVVVTLESTEFTTLHYDNVLGPLASSGAALHVVLVGRTRTGGLTDEERNRDQVFDMGARQSGGRRDMVLSSLALPDAMGKLADELSAQYRVTYARPQTLIPPEKVLVSTKRADLTARGTPVRSGATQ